MTPGHAFVVHELDLPSPTRTGERHSVDLGNVDEVVDGLNRAEAGRFRQIPLRDDQ